MTEELLAAAAVYLYSSFNNYLDAHLNTKNKAMQKYRMMKNKQLRRNCWLPMSRNRTRKRKRPPLNEPSALLITPSGSSTQPSGLLEELSSFPTELSGGANFIPMSNIDFEYILEEISPIIESIDDANQIISSKSKLALTLRYLVTGDDYESLSSLFNIPTLFILKIIPEVCAAINNRFRDVMRLPSSGTEWLTKVDGFRFPHCLSAIDSRQITLEPAYANVEDDKKGQFSIALITLVDSNYCFVAADVNTQYRENVDDKEPTDLLQSINSNSNDLKLPADTPLPGSEINVPYVFLGDETFPLSNHVMTPFEGNYEVGSPECIFNEKLALARVVVDNAFGIMSSVFRIFKNPIQLDPDKTSIIVTTCILLHNFLRTSNSSKNMYSPPESFDIYSNNQLVHPGTWRHNNQNNFIPYKYLTHKSEDESGVQTRMEIMNYLHQNIIKRE